MHLQAMIDQHWRATWRWSIWRPCIRREAWWVLRHNSLVNFRFWECGELITKGPPRHEWWETGRKQDNRSWVVPSTWCTQYVVDAVLDVCSTRWMQYTECAEMRVGSTQCKLYSVYAMRGFGSSRCMLNSVIPNYHPITRGGWHKLLCLADGRVENNNKNAKGRWDKSSWESGNSWNYVCRWTYCSRNDRYSSQ